MKLKCTEDKDEVRTSREAAQEEVWMCDSTGNPQAVRLHIPLCWCVLDIKHEATCLPHILSLSSDEMRWTDSRSPGVQRTLKIETQEMFNCRISSGHRTELSSRSQSILMSIRKHSLNECVWTTPSAPCVHCVVWFPCIWLTHCAAWVRPYLLILLLIFPFLLSTYTISHIYTLKLNSQLKLIGDNRLCKRCSASSGPAV